MIIDTNALSAWAEGTRAVEPVLLSAGRLVVPTVVLGEYCFGIWQSRHRRRYEEWLGQNLPLVEVASVSAVTAHCYAEIRLQLKRKGTPIPANDAWIGALARQHRLPILSNDIHFDFVDGIERVTF